MIFFLPSWQAKARVHALTYKYSIKQQSASLAIKISRDLIFALPCFLIVVNGIFITACNPALGESLDEILAVLYGMIIHKYLREITSHAYTPFSRLAGLKPR